ncbi:hypothetical protein M406DRAFT_343277 [Cryphonectria parasitica EP155]|uniref:DUF7702 domain-containing protein n=1 Tax=Cryphonectria parasitica (strain ATCC 38755 / EP155) TaxID=660469 RepID=A0A9P4XV52_CRYP1|nr:uncharacterized protein M406DRAFT_343277 [Cryphonectria parasitica EP155]KAF3761190.1 hypothetical protein M406DRAFT_343277 [Cryphonectria parasitica EP155]
MSSALLPGPPPTDIINLAIAELSLYIVLFSPAVWITWKHGKAGMTCWPMLVSFMAMRFASDISQIINKHEPQVTNQTLIITEAGTLACLSLTIIGLVYEANTILPVSGKGWTQKILLAFTHLTNTTGIAMCTYAGSPSPTGGVFSAPLNKVGNLMMVFVMLVVGVWIWPTWKRTKVFPRHLNARNARYLLFTAAAALPFQMVRLVYNTTYAFDHVTSLDPVMGTFATQFVLMFLMHLSVVLTSLAGGWLSRRVAAMISGSA